MLHWKGGSDFFIYYLFYPLFLFFSHLSGEREVKTQSFGRNVRALLPHLVTQDVMERLMQKVRGGMKLDLHVRVPSQTAFEFLLHTRFGNLLVLFEILIEFFPINRDSLLFCNLFGQLDWKAIGGKKNERVNTSFELL